MKKIILALAACTLLAATGYPQQDSTKMDHGKHHKSSQQKNKKKSDTGDTYKNRDYNNNNNNRNNNNMRTDTSGRM